MYSQSTINSLLGEHKAIRGHLNMVLEITSAWKAKLASRKTARISQDEQSEFSDKQAGLRQAMADLEDGLKNHHAHEDEVMPLLVGDLIMKAIRMEHNEMLERFSRIDQVLLDNLDVVLEKGRDTLEQIEELVHFVRTHSTREDGILHLLEELPGLEVGEAAV